MDVQIEKLKKKGGIGTTKIQLPSMKMINQQETAKFFK